MFIQPARARPLCEGFRGLVTLLSATLPAMSGKEKPLKIGDNLKERSHYAEEQRLGHGRIEFDELGNAIWVPFSATSSDEVMRRLLDDPTLAFSQDYSQGSQKRIEKNPQGMKKGYDPYDSGLLVKKEWKKRKDLRKLSAWIKTQKPKD
jgi:hypothetical protein